MFAQSFSECMAWLAQQRLRVQQILEARRLKKRNHPGGWSTVSREPDPFVREFEASRMELRKAIAILDQLTIEADTRKRNDYAWLDDLSKAMVILTELEVTT